MMYKNKTKQYILAITLLAAFATGFECSNSEEEPSSGTPDTSGTSGENTQTSSAPFILQLTGLEANDMLGSTKKVGIEITKKDQGGTVIPVEATDIPHLALTATSDVDDGTQATLKGGVNDLTLANTDINAGKIEKEVSIKRGTTETTLTITLTNDGVVQGTAKVVVSSKLPDLSITLSNGEPIVHDWGSQRIFNLDFTSKRADLGRNKLKDIKLQYGKPDPSCSLSFVSSTGTGKVQKVKSGVTTLKEILKANAVDELKKGVPTTLKFICEGTLPSIQLTNIKLTGTAAPDDAANYIPSITYNKPSVTLTLQAPMIQSNPSCTFTITTTDELAAEDLKEVSIAYVADPSGGKLVYNGSDLNGLDLSAIFVNRPLAAGAHSIGCTVVPGRSYVMWKTLTKFTLNLVGSANETPVTVTYNP